MLTETVVAAIACEAKAGDKSMRAPEASTSTRTRFIVRALLWRPAAAPPPKSPETYTRAPRLVNGADEPFRPAAVRVPNSAPRGQRLLGVTAGCPVRFSISASASASAQAKMLLAAYGSRPLPRQPGRVAPKISFHRQRSQGLRLLGGGPLWQMSHYL